MRAAGRTGRRSDSLRWAAGAATLAAGGAAALAVGSWLGLGYQGASAEWQVAVVVAAAVALAVGLAGPELARALASAGHYAAARRWRMPQALVPALAGLCLLLLWLGAGPRRAPDLTRPPALVIREEAAFAPGDDRPPLVVIRAPEATGVIDPGPDWKPGPDRSRLFGPAAHVFHSEDPGASLTWLRVGERRWPLVRLPPTLPLAPADGLDPARLAKRLGPTRPAAGDEPGFPIGRLVLAEKPPNVFPAFALKDSPYGNPGLKPLDARAAGLGGPLQLFQWAALPVLATAPTAAPPPGEGFVLLGQTAASNSDDIAAYALVPVLSAAYHDGQTELYLTPDPPNPVGGHGDGLDTLGESGLRQPTAFLPAAARLWRSRRFAAAGAFFVPADPVPRRTAAAADLPWDRRLPTPPQVAPPRNTPDAFPDGALLGAAAATLLLWTACRWGFARRRETS